MEVFSRIEDAFCITRSPKGIFAQKPLYHRKRIVYVAHGSGFIAVRYYDPVKKIHLTSHPDIVIIDMDEFPMTSERIAGVDHLRYGEEK